MTSDTFFIDHFHQLFVAVIFLTSSYAVISTIGKTICIGFFLLGIYVLWYKRKRFKINFKLARNLHLKNQVIAFLGVCILFGWEAFFFLKMKGFPFALPFNDTIFYSKISTFLSLTGQENIYNYEYFISGKTEAGISLYHFFELWLNNLISNTFHLLNAPTYGLITQVFLTYLVWVGVLGFIEKYRPVRYTDILLVLGLLFIESVFFEMYNQYEKLQYLKDIRISLLGHLTKKTAIYYICFVGFILNYQHRKYIEASIILLCLPLMTITAFPAVVGGLFIWGFTLFMTDNQKDAKHILILTALTAGFIGGFYAIFGQQEASVNPQSTLSGILLLKMEDIRPKINLFIGIWIQIGILYLPFLLIFMLRFKNLIALLKSDYQIIILFFAVGISGLTTWILLFRIEDTHQLFYLTTLSFLNVILMAFFIQKLVLQNYKPLILHLFLIIFLSYNLQHAFYKQKWHYNKGSFLSFHNGYIYSDNYLIKIEKLIKKYNLKRGVSYIDAKIYDKSFFKFAPHMMRLGDYLFMMENEIYTVSLHDLNLETIRSVRKHHLKNLPFYNFVKSQNNTKKTIQELQLEFIKKYRMEFLILSQNAPLNPLFGSYILKKIEDASSGEKFIIFRKEIFQ